MKTTQAQNIDEYISSFPADVQEKLIKMRAAIRKAAPKAEETIKYAIPTYTLNGNLVFFAAYKKHISFYPAPRSSPEFKKELAVYKGGKGTVQFPIEKPLPLGLIGKMVKFRVKENLEKVKLKAKKK